MNTFVAGHELDAYWETAHFGVELDTYETHGSRLSFEDDRVRDDDFLHAELVTTRVTETRLDRAPDAVIDSIRRHLARRGVDLAGEAAEEEEGVRRLLVARRPRSEPSAVTLAVGGRLGADPVGELVGGVLVGGADDHVAPAAHRLRGPLPRASWRTRAPRGGRGTRPAPRTRRGHGGRRSPRPRSRISCSCSASFSAVVEVGSGLSGSSHSSATGCQWRSSRVRLPALRVDELLDHALGLVELLAVAGVEEDPLAFVADDHPLDRCRRRGRARARPTAGGRRRCRRPRRRRGRSAVASRRPCREAYPAARAPATGRRSGRRPSRRSARGGRGSARPRRGW